MVNASASRYLHSLFTTEKWKDHFSVLSDTLGFHLTAYTDTGEQILSTEGYSPFCRKILSDTEFRYQCEAYCSSAMMSVLRIAKPIVYKCYAKIMSFAFSVEYLGEKAIILGQGSFDNYQDFRDFMNLVESHGLDQMLVTTPLQFTSQDHTRKVASLVERSINHLLRKGEEAVALQQKIDNLKSVMGKWSSAARGEPESYYEHMIAHLLTLLDIQAIMILSPDQTNTRYVSLFGMRKDGAPWPRFDLGASDRIVQELRRGKPYVAYTDAFVADRSDLPAGVKVFYFFPVVINSKLGGVVAIFESVLSQSDVNIVTAFCRQTALSIENQRLHRDLYRKFDRYTAVSQMTKDMTSIVNFDVLLQTILDRSADLLRAEQGSLMLLDRATEALLLEAKKGVMDGITEKLKVQLGEGIAGKVAEIGEPYLVEDIEGDPRVMQKNRLRYKTRSFVSVPLKIDGRVIGVLNLSDKETGEPFNDEDLALIQSFATHAAIVMERNQLYSQSETLKRLSITDSLTGLLNRRYLLERLEEELSRAGRHSRNLSLLMLDIDGFKTYNDTYGHPMGDKALKMISDTVLASIRTMDIAARYGGDEFIVVLPETDAALAVNIAERLRADMAKTELPTLPGMAAIGNTLTLSIGVACYPQHGMTAESLLENADKALYRAKNQGKNRIEVFS